MCDNNTDSFSYNCRVFSYPVGEHVTVYDRTITKGTKNEKLTKAHQEKKERNEKQEEHSKQVSLSRTKNNIYNIARSNVWEWFITLTFDRKITDSSSYDEVVERLQRYLENIRSRKCPDMKYLIVPELHSDGVHYHFHGLLSNVDGMRFKFSGKYSKDMPIYNIVDWSYGFTTATRVTDTQKVSSYITKYITKSSEQYLKEKRRYYASRNIEKAVPTYTVIDEEDFQKTYTDRITYCKTINIKQALQQVTYYELQD